MPDWLREGDDGGGEGREMIILCWITIIIRVWGGGEGMLGSGWWGCCEKLGRKLCVILWKGTWWERWGRREGGKGRGL